MANIKTFRVNGTLQYNDIDDNFDNLNNQKIERVVNVNDATPAIQITQTGAGESIVVNTNEFVVDENGNVGIGTNNPVTSLDLSAKTDGIVLPKGTSAERISTEGTIRYNKDTKRVEGYVNSKWVGFSSNLNIEKITTAGYNGIQIFGEGQIYFTSGIATSYGVSTNGRNAYTQGISSAGFGDFQKIIIPDSSPVIDSGTLSHYAASYALCANGNLYTWGYNLKGQCGVGSTTPTPQPTLATTNVTKVFTHSSNGGQDIGDTRLIVLKSDGYLYGCGHNSYGQFGLGTTSNAVASFTQLTAFGNSIKNAWNLGTTYGALLVQKTDNTIWVAGSNLNGFFGNGTTSVSYTPINITSNWIPDTSYEIKYVGFSSGYYDSARNSTCMLIMLSENSSGQQVLRTAGGNQWGTIGNNSIGGNVTTAYNVSILKPVRQVLASGAIPGVFLLYTDGTLYSWGYNGHGNLGNGGTADTGTPTQVLTDVKFLPSIGFDANAWGYRTTNFAVKNDGTLWACGWNNNGEAGVGTTGVNAQATWAKCIIPVTQTNTIKMIGGYATTTAGFLYLAIREDDEIFGWGYNGHYGVSMNGISSNVVSATNFKLKIV